MNPKEVTSKKYNEMKRFIKANAPSPADDAKTMSRFGYSQTTVRMIRRSKNYAEYCERRFRFHGHPKKFKPETKPDLEAENRAAILGLRRALAEADKTATRFSIYAIVLAVLVIVLVLVEIFS